MRLCNEDKCPVGIIDNSSPVFNNSLTLFEPVSSMTATCLIAYIASIIKSYALFPKTVYIMGCAGGGKSYLARKLVEHFSNIEKANPFCLATDDYCIGTRNDRRKIIKQTGDALKEKDFALMEKHITKIKALKAGEQLILPREYDPKTGLALAGKDTRAVRGPVGVLIIDGNFYVKAKEDLLVFLHVPDPIRYRLRLIRDTKKGQQRAASISEVITQFRERQETQDKRHTLPYLRKAAILIESKPYIKDCEIKAAEYVVWRNKSTVFPAGKNASRKESSQIFLQS